MKNQEIANKEYIFNKIFSLKTSLSLNLLLEIDQKNIFKNVLEYSKYSFLLKEINNDN